MSGYLFARKPVVNLNVCPKNTTLPETDSEVFNDVNAVFVYECGVCFDKFTIDHMFSLVYCQHKICMDCAKQHFGCQIKNNSVYNVTCPYPNCTDITKMDTEDRQQYFSLLTCQLRVILGEEFITLLDTKLRDLTLLELDGFFWCPKCLSGQLALDDHRIVEFVQCFNCFTHICPGCKDPWTQDHRGKSCELYKKFKTQNQLNKEQEQVKSHVDKYGIQCPSCKSQFMKSSGGCLHMTCTVCKHQFCEGCLAPFALGKNCKVTNGHCGDQGLHAHHPRNCFYFLRDWTPQQLQKLLTRHSILFDTISVAGDEKCAVMEQKEKEDGVFADEECGLPNVALYAGMCEKHYIQYLSVLVIKNKLDPLPEYTCQELEVLFQKNGLVLPKNTMNNDTMYHEDLLQGIYAYGVERIVQNTLLSDPRNVVPTEEITTVEDDDHVSNEEKVTNDLLADSLTNLPVEDCNTDSQEDDYEDCNESDVVIDNFAKGGSEVSFGRVWNKYRQVKNQLEAAVADSFAAGIRNDSSLTATASGSNNNNNALPATDTSRLVTGLAAAIALADSAASTNAAISVAGSTAPAGVEAGSVAAGNAATIMPKLMPADEEDWSCAYCTYVNEIDSIICEMCNRSKAVGEVGVQYMWLDGVQCTKCTLINTTGLEECEACGETLSFDTDV